MNNVLKRTFIAVDIPPNDTVTGLLRDIRSGLKGEKIKWTLPSQFHITLQFLGDTETSDIKNINYCIEEITKKFNPFTLKVGGPGVFKNMSNPRVFWLDIQTSSTIGELKMQLDKSIEIFGYKPDSRPFKPHLTIGRIKNIKDTENLSHIIERYKNAIFQEIVIDHVVFYESILKKEGPEYVVLERHYMQ